MTLLRVTNRQLVAFYHALRVAEKCEEGTGISIVTDGSYVCFIDFVLRQNVIDFPHHRVRHGDIIKLIQRHWNPRIKVLKTKSRRSVDDTNGWLDLWTLYGNFAADFAASAALKRVPQVVTDMLHELATFHKNEVSRLHNVLAYLVDLNRCRIGALKKGFNIVGQPEVLEADISASLLPPKAMGLDALDFLKSFAPAHYVPFV